MDLRSSASDTAVALLIVGAVLGGLYLFAGSWPPMVVVESRSMMHPQDDPGYGNLGTADPGDILFLQNVENREDVSLAVDREVSRYGGDGDIVVFKPNGNPDATPIIHRALTYVRVQGSGEDAEYEVHMGGSERRVFGPEGIYLPELGIGEGAGYTDQNGWKPGHDGLLTQGDNPETNPHPDQVSSPPISEPVRVEWIEGKARGELPWLGLVKLAFGTDLNVNPPPADWVRFGNAYAPADLWIMLFASGLTLVVIPLGYDVYREWQRTDRVRFPPYLTRLRKRYGSPSGGTEESPESREPVAELQGQEDDEQGGGDTTTFQVVSSEKGGE